MRHAHLNCTKNLPDRLKRYGRLSLWCRAEGKIALLKKFTLESLNHTSNRVPYIGGKAVIRL